MLGWINTMLKCFILETFGEDAWRQVRAKAGVGDSYVSTCPYADSATYK